MNSKIMGVMGVMGLAALCGCGPDPRDAKIAALETRLAEAEHKLEQIPKLDQSIGEIDAKVMAVKTNVLDALSEMRERQDEMIALATGLQAMVLQATNPIIKTQFVARYYTVPAAAQPAQARSAGITKEGVPATVYQQIAAAAEREWPGNFEMQAYEIRNQVEAYRKLHP